MFNNYDLVIQVLPLIYSATEKQVTQSSPVVFVLENHTEMSRLDSVESISRADDYDIYVKFKQDQQVHNFFIGVHGPTKNQNYHLSRNEIQMVGSYIKFTVSFDEDITKLVFEKPDEDEEIDLVYVTGGRHIGRFFTVGALDKSKTKLEVAAGSLYNLKLKVKNDLEWSGPATVAINGFGKKLGKIVVSEKKVGQIFVIQFVTF